MRILLFSLLIFLSSTVFAQRYTVTGQMVDTLHAPLPSATVMVLQVKDSSLVNFGASNASGFFEIRNVVRGDYFIKVSYVGFAPFTKRINFPESGTLVEMGMLKMEAKSTELEAITIQSEAAPVTIKRDTIEFNAPSFKVAPNSNVEDLLKRLPGVEVESDGTVKAQGETVQRVTIDGKEFFGRDPKIATRNLPADAIQKVQVFDRRSDQALFSGIDDGQREKTINLELKEKNRNGAFGNVTAGYGTDDRYLGKANLNKFSKGNQLSFIGMANNINEQGFSIQDYMNFSGGIQQMAGGGGSVRIGGGGQGGAPINQGRRSNGIMTNYAGGLNFNRTLNKKTELNGSYFLNHLDHNIIKELERENFLPSGNFNFIQNSIQQSNNTGHRFNTVLDHKIDSANSIRFTSSLNYNLSRSDTRSESRNLSEGDVLQNEGESLSMNDAKSLAYNGNLLLRHRFKKAGRTISANLLFSLNQNESEGLLLANNTFYTGMQSTENLRQENYQDNKNYSYGTTLSYTEPLGNRMYLELNYNYIQNYNKVDREVYDIDNNENLSFNPLLSNKFNSNYQYHRPGANFRLNRKNFNFMAGASLQQTYLTGELLLLDATIDRDFQNILPSVRFNYNFSSSKSLSLDYETSVQEPSIQQLQPVVDNSDPLNIYVGNPELKPSYNNRIIFRFNTFDPGKFISFFTTASVNYVKNPITNEQSIDERFIRTTRPVNVEDGLTYTTNATLSVPVTKLKSRFSVGGNYLGNRYINLLNDEANNIRNQVIGGNIRYTFTYKEIFDLNFSANLSENQTRYEFNTNQDQLFFNQNYSSELNLTVLKDFNFNTTYNYLIYESVTTDFRQAIPYWNVSLSRFFLKNKSGELKFAINNILDQDLGIQQRASVNYFERETTNSLGRFYMVSFTYAINKAMNPMNMRRGGGGMRMMQIMGS
jgi:hypothetical protein